MCGSITLNHYSIVQGFHFLPNIIINPTDRFNTAIFVCLSQARTTIYNVICRSLVIFSELWREVIVRFVDIGGIVEHHRLNFQSL